MGGKLFLPKKKRTVNDVDSYMPRKAVAHKTSRTKSANTMSNTKKEGSAISHFHMHLLEVIHGSRNYIRNYLQNIY